MHIRGESECDEDAALACCDCGVGFLSFSIAAVRSMLSLLGASRSDSFVLEQNGARRVLSMGMCSSNLGGHPVVATHESDP